MIALERLGATRRKLESQCLISGIFSLLDSLGSTGYGRVFLMPRNGVGTGEGIYGGYHNATLSQSRLCALIMAVHVRIYCSHETNIHWFGS